MAEPQPVGTRQPCCHPEGMAAGAFRLVAAWFERAMVGVSRLDILLGGGGCRDALGRILSDCMNKLRELLRACYQALDDVTPARLLVVGLIIGLIIVHGVRAASFEVDGITIGLMAVLVIVVLVPLLESATLPLGGGFKLHRRLDELKGETDAAVKGQELVNERTGREEAEGAQQRADSGSAASAEPQTVDSVVAHVLEQAQKSPRLGLIVLASELDRAVRDLLRGTGWWVEGRTGSLGAGVVRLAELGVLAPSMPSAVENFMAVRNDVVHGGQRVTDEDILRAVDTGVTLLRAVGTVPRERNFVSAVGVPLYKDETCTQPIEDATGVILRTVSPGGTATSFRIFPTTRSHFQVGREVAWKWNPERQWGPAWYRDEDGEVHQAWGGSLEFVGRQLDEL